MLKKKYYHQIAIILFILLLPVINILLEIIFHLGILLGSLVRNTL